MKTTYILDTSALIHDPKCYHALKNAEIIIPVDVLNELDKLKTGQNEAAKNARVAIRLLDEVCNSGQIHKGIKLENGSTLKIDTSIQNEEFGKNSYADNTILACALTYLIKNFKKKVPTPTVLLSRDINLRIRAQAAGIEAKHYEKDSKSRTEELYTGVTTVCSEELADELNETEMLHIGMFDELKDLVHNQGVYFTNENDDVLAIGRRVGDKVVKLKNKKPWGVDSRSKEQALAIDYCFDPKIQLLTLSGGPGCGKTIIALACALELVLTQKKYKKITVFRPISSIPGQDIGYLPGDKSSKVIEHFGAIMDNLENLLGGTGKQGKDWQTMLDLWMEKGLISFEPLTFIRGRNLADQVVIFDEIQNTNSFAAKTLLSRISSNTKVIFTGDINQIDQRDLDSGNNAMTAVVSAFKDQDLYAHVKFLKCERSRLAELADELL